MAKSTITVKQIFNKRGNEKRAFWVKRRIFNDAKYKAYNAGILTKFLALLGPHTHEECGVLQKDDLDVAGMGPAQVA